MMTENPNKSRRYDSDTIYRLLPYFHQSRIPVRFDQASLGEDKNEATDLWVTTHPYSQLYQEKLRMQVRLREETFRERYYNEDFTISAEYAHHVQQYGEVGAIERSEWYKLQQFGVAYYLYGIRGPNYTVARFRLIDLLLFTEYSHWGEGNKQWKRNGVQAFWYFRWDELPDGCVLFEYQK